MRKAAIGKPELFIEVCRFQNERIAIPLADRAAVVQGVVTVPLNLSCVDAAIGVNQTIIPIAASDKYENALEVTVLDELHSIRKLIFPRSAWRFTIEKHRIVFQKVALAEFVQILSPTLKRCDFCGIRNILQKTVGIHLDIDSGFHQGRSAGKGPISGLARRSAQPGLAVGIP